MKNKIITCVAAVFAFFVYSVVLFRSGIEKQDVFWLDYYFTAFAFLIFISTAISAEGKRSFKQYFKDKAIIAGCVYTAVQLVLGLRFINYPNSEVVLPCFVQIIIMGIFVISLLFIKKTSK